MMHQVVVLQTNLKCQCHHYFINFALDLFKHLKVAVIFFQFAVIIKFANCVGNLLEFNKILIEPCLSSALQTLLSHQHLLFKMASLKNCNLVSFDYLNYSNFIYFFNSTSLSLLYYCLKFLLNHLSSIIIIALLSFSM